MRTNIPAATGKVEGNPEVVNSGSTMVRRIRICKPACNSYPLTLEIKLHRITRNNRDLRAESAVGGPGEPNKG